MALRCKPEKAAEGEEDTRTMEQRFEDFTRVLPWFGFAADINSIHKQRRKQVREEAEALPATLDAVAKGDGHLSELMQATIQGVSDAPSFVELAEAALQREESAVAGSPAPRLSEQLAALRGKWEILWVGAFSPLQRFGFPKQCIWMEVKDGEEGKEPVITCHAGVPLLFGFYLWTSNAGQVVEGEPPEPGRPGPALISFNRYWIDLAREPRDDIGRIDGGFVTNRLSAFAAALVTPVLLEFGALRWVLERFGIQKVFEVEVPSNEGEGKTVKLQASLELYLTLLAMVAFPDSLSTCPVPYVDADAGLCVFEIPMLGVVGDLPRWLHPGGNAAAMVARRLSSGEEPGMMRS